ncbi:MAG TPA: hypothetical protein VFB88_14000 [Xanthobacteraceae bacterium]|nr:hypothetical protein [Xanthobacteraceae bacterium]
MSIPDFDQLVPDPQARAELGNVTAMTFWRWDRDPAMAELGWSPPVKIGRRNYRSRRVIERVKAALIEQAMKRQGVV